jgi:hypothetical protein
MRHSKSRSKVSFNSNSKSSTLKFNADIESSLLLNTNKVHRENEISKDNKDMKKIKRNIDFLGDEKTDYVSFLEDKYNSKKKENSQLHNKNANIYSSYANKSDIKTDIIKTTDSRTVIQNTNENGFNNYNTNKTNSINTEKFDKSYTSYIIKGNKKNTDSQKNSMNLTTNTNFYIKSNTNILHEKFEYLNKKQNINIIIDESFIGKDFEGNEEKEDNKIIKSSERDHNINTNNDGMFVTSTIIKAENNNGEFSNRRNSKTKGNINLNNKQKENLLKSRNDNLKNNNKTINNNGNTLKLNEQEICEINKIIEKEINKTNQKFEYSGLGSQYNKINSFDLKFNKDLAKISPLYGKIDSRNKFANKDQFDELIQEVKDFQTYRNIKIVNDKQNHRFRLLPLINNKKNSYEVLANNFFCNIKTQKESPEYFNIDDEFENYIKNKSDKEKYKSIFDEEESQV